MKPLNPESIPPFFKT